MLTFPNCKINLGLHVINKRPDGFHNIETVFYPVQWQDALEVIENKYPKKTKVVFTPSGLTIDGRTEDNLCVRAYNLLDADFDLPPVKIYLRKNIPMGAGLGGGSADAACTIKLLNEKFELKLTGAQMRNYAVKLGSDCAVFIDNKPVFAYGRGEKFKPVAVDLTGWFIAVVHPGIHVSTADAYAGVQKRGKTEGAGQLQQQILLPVSKWKRVLENDFELSVFQKHKSIGRLKQKMYDAGAVYAAMSGSGSAVFGLFKEEPRLTTAMKKMRFYTGKL